MDYIIVTVFINLKVWPLFLLLLRMMVLFWACYLPPDSPLLSLGYEYIILEDLKLYNAKCVYYLFIKFHRFKCKCISLEVVLTDKQVNALNGCINELKAANYKA
jgi:hypothetical protein